MNDKDALAIGKAFPKATKEQVEQYLANMPPGTYLKILANHPTGRYSLGGRKGEYELWRTS